LANKLCTPYATSGPLAIGAYYTTGNYRFDGLIDEVRVYNRTQSDDEVYQDYVSNLYKYDTNAWAS